MAQGLGFAGDLKLGHYMHIPPKMMFWVQVLATIWGGLVNVAVLYWSYANIRGICTPDAVQSFVCPGATTFFTASIVWGAIGPQRMFEHGQVYYANIWFFLIGAVAPVPIYILARRNPTGPWRFLNMPLFFSATDNLPPATAIKCRPKYLCTNNSYATWSFIGFMFNYLLRRRQFAWWSKYNFEVFFPFL